jgi:cytochrome b6
MHAPSYVEKLPDDKKTNMPFFPNFLLRDTLLWLIVLNLLLYLAVFFPWELGEKADLFAPAPEGIKPEWYFMFMFQTLKLIPAHVLFIEGEILGIVGFGLMGLGWMLVPFWEKRLHPDKRKSFITVVGIVGILFILIMTIWGYVV